MSNEQKHSISRSWNDAKRAQTIDHWMGKWEVENRGVGGGGRSEKPAAQPDTDAATTKNKSHCQNSKVIANRQTRAVRAKECMYACKNISEPPARGIFIEYYP